VILGLDIGGTKTAVVLGTREGAICLRKEFATAPQRGFQKTFAELTAVVRGVLDGAPEPVEAISVSIGGPLDVEHGIIYSPPNLPGWNAIPLKKMLTEAFSLPVYIEHDGNAGALAEWYFGAGKGFSHIVFITMGTGFGAGMILNGRLYRGANDLAGEIGHIRIAENGPLCYGKAGSMEGFGSGTGIIKLAHHLFPGMWNDSATAAEVYRSWQSGSHEARQVFEHAGFRLGRGLALLIDMLNPQRIILGGLGMRIYDALLPFAQAVIQDEALPEAVRVCEIVPAGLGESIGDVASLCAALDQGEFTGHSR